MVLLREPGFELVDARGCAFLFVVVRGCHRCGSTKRLGRSGYYATRLWAAPVADPDGEIRGPLTVLNIKLSSPFGEAHFEAPAEAIVNFLDRTYSIVRMGQESSVIDIDAELNDLLWQA